MTLAAAIQISRLAHRYGHAPGALTDLSFVDRAGRDLCLPRSQRRRQDDTVSLALDVDSAPVGSGRDPCRYDLAREAARVRRRIGVVFQAPSLDKKLTVAENIRHQGHLYGLSGGELEARQDEMLDRLGLTDRASDRCETLSGGLRRRVELAKGMLHRPRLLLLDEPRPGSIPALAPICGAICSRSAAKKG